MTSGNGEKRFKWTMVVLGALQIGLALLMVVAN